MTGFQARILCALASVASALCVSGLLNAQGAPQQKIPRLRRAEYCLPNSFVTLPPGWTSGDTHEHKQHCTTPVDDDDEALYAEMIASRMNVLNLLVWRNPFTSLPELIEDYLPLVTGTEHPLTQGDPDHVIQYGIELSGFRVSPLGHIIALNVSEVLAEFLAQSACQSVLGESDLALPADQTGDYQAPMLDYFKGKPGVVTGYAHQFWPVTVSGQDGWGPNQYVYPAFNLAAGFANPFLAPFDVAYRRIDFLEALDLFRDVDFDQSVHEYRWHGLYYKLLNAGRRISISGGTDADCLVGEAPLCEVRSYVKLPDGVPLSYQAWVDSLAAGRVGVAMGAHQFITIEVDGIEVGGELDLESVGGTANVSIRAELLLAGTEYVPDAIEIIRNGEVIHTQEIVRQEGNYVVQIGSTINRSSWFAARLRSHGAHTGAIFAFLDRKPIVSFEAADYWVQYCDYLIEFLDLADSLPGRGLINAIVGCSENEIRGYIASGRRFYEALRDYAADLPNGLVRRGYASPACDGPPAIVASDNASPGQPWTVRCFDAPPEASGTLILGALLQESPPARALDGADVFVTGVGGPNDVVLLPVVSDRSGLVEVVVPGSMTLSPFFAQFLWTNTPSCGALTFSASDAFEVTPATAN